MWSQVYWLRKQHSNKETNLASNHQPSILRLTDWESDMARLTMPPQLRIILLLIKRNTFFTYLWLQKHIVSRPTILQSIPFGAVQLTKSLFFILMGRTFFLYSSYSSGVNNFPPSSSPTILTNKNNDNPTINKKLFLALVIYRNVKFRGDTTQPLKNYTTHTHSYVQECT